MVTTLAQLIVLTAYGNDYLRNGRLPDGFDSVNTTFQFCNTVDFSVFKKKLLSAAVKEVVVADSPSAWFKRLNADGCKSLRLYYERSKPQATAKDHKTAGFVGGGGTWLVEAVYNGYSEYWAGRWEVTNQNAPDRKIWAVHYGRSDERQSIHNLQTDNQTAKDELEHTLAEISDFARRQKFENWAEVFDKAKAALESGAPEENYYHGDLIPFENYSLTARQLLFSAGHAWVFGGMGSWNDLGCANKEDNDTYERLSAELYENIIVAIISAVNSY